MFWPDSYNALPNIRLDLELQADKNVRLRNPAVYDMYIQGKVKAQGTLKHPITSGRVTVTRGTLQYLSTPFKITEGVADFNQYDSLLPTIRVLAETRTLETKIHLQATGPLAQMEIRLTSEPPLSQQQIIKLLTLREKQSRGNSGGGSGETGAGDATDKDDLVVLLHEGLQFTFVQRVEKVLEDFLGVDEVHVVRGENAEVTDKEVYNLEVGKFVSDKLFLGYTLGTDQTDRTFRFRYDITSHLALDGEMDEQANRSFGLEARFSF
jgi:translocation and assembly module TamB